MLGNRQNQHRDINLLGGLDVVVDPVNLAPMVCGVDIIHEPFEFDVALEAPPINESGEIVHNPKQVLSGSPCTIQNHV